MFCTTCFGHARDCDCGVLNNILQKAFKNIPIPINNPKTKQPPTTAIVRRTVMCGCCNKPKQLACRVGKCNPSK